MLRWRSLANLPPILAILMLSGVHNQAASGTPDEINLKGLPGPYNFGKVCRLKTTELWVVGGDGTVQYRNAAGTVERRITDEDLNAVYFPTTNMGWVVGANGNIFRTEDQGHSWSLQLSGVKDSLNGIKCSSESRCWVVGKAGIVLNTIDSGEHWDTKNSKTSADLFAVDFVDDQVGWAAGEGGLLLHTTNGGESWETQHAIITLFPSGSFATPTDLRTVKFIDRETGWVAGAGGVARTKDGGKTWDANEIAGASFIGLVSIDGNTVWAISGNGTNYVTKNSGKTWEPTIEKTLAAKRSTKRPGQVSSISVPRRWH